MWDAIGRFIGAVTRHPISLVGSIVTTLSAITFAALLLMHLVSEHGGGPYLGIMTFLILPGVFVAGLLLIPIGLARERALRRAEGASHLAFAVIDLNDRATRRAVAIFLAATGLNVLIVSVGTFKGVEVMDSTRFCGATCHTVMEPEYTTYKRSPHARVKCAECHIGEGAGWFVKSKLSGSWQLVSVALDLYPKPIPAPVHNLRPARETCEHCHWPQKFVGDRLKVLTRHADDEANTELQTVLVMRVGGVRANGAGGIHWHVDPSMTLRYRSDPTRQTVYEVEVTQGDGKTRRFAAPAAETPEGRAVVEWRTMDCVDCHNRPTHVYRMPEEEVDQALVDGRISKGLPFVRREALLALKQPYKSHQEAREGIARRLTEFYGQSAPEIAKTRSAEVAAASQAVGDIFAWNVFPEMNVGWGTYPNHLGHTTSNGCFRCHDEEHKSNDGKTISQDCSTCHSLLADGEKDPEVLKTLFP